MPSSSSKHSKRPSLHSRKSSAPKTPVQINIYDLLPPSAFSSLLWPLGLSLLHTGVVLLGREYSYGATSVPHTGIFSTPPLTPPPGGTHRLTHLQGFTYLSPKELENVIHEAKKKYPGTEYNLLSNNCNHFTNYMCRTLTGREMPAFINRAARVATMLPCLVPKDWATGPDIEDSASPDGHGASSQGRVQDSDSEEGEEDEEERQGILWRDRRKPPPQRYFDNPEEERIRNGRGEWRLWGRGQGRGKIRDAEGRGLPASEVAPAESLI
jgi:hypothetical protein